jgi:hypothetical protein
MKQEERERERDHHDGQAGRAAARRPRALDYYEAGLTDSDLFNHGVSALIADVLDGTVGHKQGRVAVAGSTALLKNADLAQRHGRDAGGGRKVLALAAPLAAGASAPREEDAAVALRKHKLALLDELSRLEAQEA